MYIMVLADGETYSPLEGCTILQVSGTDLPELDESVKEAIKNGYCSGPNQLYYIHTVTKFDRGM